jgi:hypothetical protein
MRPITRPPVEHNVIVGTTDAEIFASRSEAQIAHCEA